MTDRENHIAWASEALERFQQYCSTGDAHAVADLICDLGHLSDKRGLDFLEAVRRGIRHWHIEREPRELPALGADVDVTIIVGHKRRKTSARSSKFEDFNIALKAPETETASAS